jgi:hypothetical protein
MQHPSAQVAAWANKNAAPVAGWIERERAHEGLRLMRISTCFGRRSVKLCDSRRLMGGAGDGSEDKCVCLELLDARPLAAEGSDPLRGESLSTSPGYVALPTYLAAEMFLIACIGGPGLAWKI